MKKYFLKYAGKSEKEVTKTLYDVTFKQKISGTISNFKTANGIKGRIQDVEEETSSYRFRDEKKEDSLFGGIDFGGGSSGGGSDNDYSGGGGDFGGGGASDGFGGDGGSSD